LTWRNQYEKHLAGFVVGFYVGNYTKLFYN